MCNTIMVEASSSAQFAQVACKLLVPDCVRFSGCSLIMRTSAVASRLHLLQAAHSDCFRFVGFMGIHELGFMGIHEFIVL